MPATRAALSARQAGSEPSSCGRTGTPAGVRPPWASSGTTRKNTRSGSKVLVTRMNSETQRSIPPTRVSTSRNTKSSRPSIGARTSAMRLLRCAQRQRGGLGSGQLRRVRALCGPAAHVLACYGGQRLDARRAVVEAFDVMEIAAACT